MTPDSMAWKCPECGRPLAMQGAPCPACEATHMAWSRSRAVILTLCGLLLGPMFVITGGVVRLFHARQARIGRDWNAAGQVNLRNGRASEAIEDFRNALLYSPEDEGLQLELAQALMQEGHLDEAQEYLFGLRARDPENAKVNLELARVAEKRSNVDAASKYFHDAMYGHWDQAPSENRLATRTMLIEYLLDNERREQARAESLVMAAENPADPDVRVRAGNFLLRAGDAQSAIGEFQRAIQLAPRKAEAFNGAGEAAETLGDFRRASRNFARAQQLGVEDQGVGRERKIAGLAAELDPFEAGLRETEKRRRVMKLFEAAEDRAQACFPAVLGVQGTAVPAELSGLADERKALPRRITESDLRLHPEHEDQMQAWVWNVEKEAEKRCGAGSETDQAIALIAGKHQEG